MATPDSLIELPKVVEVADQPCQQLYEANPVLLGFDVVHYHYIPSYKDGGVAQQGSPEFAYNFNGYQFWFASEENRKLFIGDPWKYAPAWGGFCSYGIALERQPEWPWETDFLGPPASPWEGWAIIDGVLTFNIWSSYTDRFLENAETNMELAAQRWKEMFDGELRAGPFNTHCIGHGNLKNWCLTQQPSPWLEPLPECGNATTATTATTSPSGDGIATTTTSNGSGGGTTTTTTTIASGGGIVSNLDSFEDFDAPSDLSPFQRRWIGIGVAIGVVAVALLFCLLFFYRSSKRSGSRPLSQKSPPPQESSNSSSTKNGDSSSADGDDEEQASPTATKS